MTIGPEPMMRIFRRSARLGTTPPRGRTRWRSPAPPPRACRGRRRAVLADPRDLAVAPELLAQDAHPPLDPLADRVGFEGRVARRRERRPLGLLAGPFGLPIRDQVIGHDVVQPPFSVMRSVNRRNRYAASCGPGDASG